MRRWFGADCLWFCWIYNWYPVSEETQIVGSFDTGLVGTMGRPYLLKL